MAVLGAQLVFSLVMFSFLHKLSPYYSFARWLLCDRLFRYLHPSDDELRSSAGIPHSGGGKNRGRKNEWKKQTNGVKKEILTIPKNTPIHLDTAPVRAIDIIQLHYYSDYKWLIDFSLSACIIYILTEGYLVMFPGKPEINISVLWCLLAIAFCLRVLFSQTAMYFRTEDGGERMLCITFGFFFLVAAMAILVVDDEILEFGLEDGYNNFSGNALTFLKQQGIESHGPLSLLTFKIILALICSIVGALLTFPGLRYARIHLDAIKYSRERPLMQVLLHINFILPLVIVLLWVKPLGRDIICGKDWKVVKALMNETKFESVRLLLFVILVLFRLFLLPKHLQSHLNLAYEKIDNLKKESGRISSTELQTMVASVFYYLCVVALQYMAPVLFLMFLSFLLKTLGEYSWVDFLGETFTEQWLPKLIVQSKAASSQAAATATAAATNSTIDAASGSIAEATAQLTWAMTNLRSVFTSVWYRGILSFLTWWVCAAWFTSTAFGMAYYSRINTV